LSAHFCFHITTTTQPYTLSLHDALPISAIRSVTRDATSPGGRPTPRSSLRYLAHSGVLMPMSLRWASGAQCPPRSATRPRRTSRSEEHTSELQSLRHLVCRLLLEKKNDP